MKERRNFKTVKITIPNEAVLRKINTIPTFSRLSRNSLTVGENFETVNHKQFTDQMRLYPIAGAKIEDIKNYNITIL